MNKRVVHIVDGSGYIFRAYYAIRALSTPEGEATNAVYGFTTMIEKALREEEPHYMAITFDPGGSGFRRELYQEYKANRPPPPEDLALQIPRIHQIANAFRLANFTIPGFEADDVIATLVRMAREAGNDVLIITGDKDLMQLVDDHVTLYEPMRNQRFGPKEVEEKMGVPPSLVADALALSGDSVDNIPGVRGVGLKTAAKLLMEHGNLDNVLIAAKTGGVKGKIGEKIAASEADARLSRKLVALRDDVVLPLTSIEELHYPGPDKAALRALYVELDFKRLVPKLDAENASYEPEEEEAAEPEGPSVTLNIEHDAYRTITHAEQLAELVRELGKAKRIAMAAEMATTRSVDSEVVGLAFSAKRGRAAYVPVGHSSVGPLEQIPLADVVAALRPILEDATRPKVSAETKVIVALFERLGVPIRGLSFDSTLASYLLEPDEMQHGPEAVARRYFGHDAVDRTKLLTVDRKRRTFAEVSLEDATRAVGERADIALAAAEIMPPALVEAQVDAVLKDVELPLIPVLARMELAGIRIDVGRLEEMSSRFEVELAELETACFEAAGQEFNIGSPKQLQKVLFEDLGLKIVKRKKTGPSTDQSVLEVLADSHPLPQAILDHRQVQKLKSTYVDALPKMVSPVTGRVHTVFGQATAATGRLSSNDPNLQNIPIRRELGREIRKVFVADAGNQLISVDYSQVELRVLAHFSRDAVLNAAFRDNADVHTRTASVLFEIPPEEVTREQRTQAKAVNFGVLYGMGPVRLARDLKIPRRTASKFVEDYFDRQPGVRAFIDETLENAKKTGEVRTILGRRRMVKDINSKNRGARAAAERIAVNTPIQGTAADLIKLAMIRVDAVLTERFPAARLLLQVHDELLLEAPEAEAKDVAEMVKREMENIYPLDVPLLAEAHVGANWDAAH